MGRSDRGPLLQVGIDPEGIDQNPAYYSFLLETAWRSKPVNTTAWLQHWGRQRCGHESDKVAQAWGILANTVYADAGAQVYEHHMAYCPTTMPEGSGWDKNRVGGMVTPGHNPLWYDPSDLHVAWGLLIEAATASDCGEQNDAFTFDLVDVGREYLSIVPCNDAYDALINATTAPTVKAANASMSEVMADLDSLLGSSFGFLLGAWIADARAMAPAGTSDADFLEWNARSQVTSWFPVQQGSPVNPEKPCAGTPASSLDGLWDYGNKAWSGLVKGFYDKRYQLYADHKLFSVQASGAADAGTMLSPKQRDAYHSAVMNLACEFSHTTGAALPTKATGDAASISKALWAKYAPTTSAAA